jgi:hypothetical protein
MYTLKMAVKLQWFAKAHIEGEWKIPIYYDAFHVQFFIKIDGEYWTCVPIQQKQIDQARIHKDIALFRQLKEQWLQNRTGNKAGNTNS